MTPGDGSEPIADDEIVFRRASENSRWYNPESDRPIAWEAFRLNEKDRSGISVWRAKYKSPMDAAAVNARPGHRYYILVLAASRLRAVGVEIVPTPEEGGPGDASLLNINTDAHASDKNRIRELASTIAESLVERVEGPFGPFET